MQLFKGSAAVAGRRSDHGLYDHDLATYDAGDQFDQTQSAGFVQALGAADAGSGRGARATCSTSRCQRSRGRLWGGRFAEAPAEAAWALGRSVALRRAAVRPTTSPGRAPTPTSCYRIGVLDAGELEALLEALDAIGEEFAAGTFAFRRRRRGRPRRARAAPARAVAATPAAKLRAGRSPQRPDRRRTCASTCATRPPRSVDGRAGAAGRAGRPGRGGRRSAGARATPTCSARSR